MKGSELSPFVLRYGYEHGCFPMTMESGDVEWWQPRMRCLFPIEGIHVSRSLAKVIRKGKYVVTFDQAFEDVMRHCLRTDGNWISEDFIRVYTQVHREGWGHSCETWLDGRLVGGVYGLALGACFCAESMFFRERDASKVALYALVNKCRELGFDIVDAQITNPHLESLGSYEIGHRTFMERLQKALNKGSDWDDYKEKIGA